MNALAQSTNLAHDSAARAYVKDETVTVAFAERDGERQSSVGINRYCAGDALVTGSNGDTWSVSRVRFEARYAATAEANRYRARPIEVLAKPMHTAFSIQRSAGGDVLRGDVGDWLLQYAPGDFGVVDAARFAQVYRAASSDKKM